MALKGIGPIHLLEVLGLGALYNEYSELYLKEQVFYSRSDQTAKSTGLRSGEFEGQDSSSTHPEDWLHTIPESS